MKNSPVVFIGHFSPREPVCPIADSPAANQVQRKINACLSDLVGDNSFCFSMISAAAFPRGPLVVRSGFDGNIKFIGYINIYMIKHIIFSMRLLCELLIIKPNLCIQYNSYPFENIILLLYRFIRAKVFLSLIVQDVNILSNSKNDIKQKIKNMIEYFGLSFLKNFNLIVPVSSKIADEFKVSSDKSFIFPGGVTFFAEELLKVNSSNLTDFAVYAGKLEKYNGFDRLMKAWANQNINYCLHIFGNGSLENKVKAVASKSKFIKFHGKLSEIEILDWQSRARWNFCLRYSDEIQQDYFFPSKLFNICCAPGLVLINKFNGIPNDIMSHVCVIDDDLNGIGEFLHNTKDSSLFIESNERRSLVSQKYRWEFCIKRIIEYWRDNHLQ